MIANLLRSLILPEGALPGNAQSGHAPAIANVNYPWTLNNPNLDLRDYSTWEAVLDGYGSSQSASGIRVTHDDLLTFGPVVRAALIIGGDIAASPLRVCWATVPAGDDPVDDNHPANRVVSKQWNDYTSAAAGWEQAMQERCLFGESFVWVERDHTGFFDARNRNWGAVTGLYNLPPLHTKPKIASEYAVLGSEQTGFLEVVPGERYYESVIGGMKVYLAFNEVLHFRHFRASGLKIISILRDVVGLALAARGFQSKFFANGAQAGGFIAMKPGTTPASRDNLQKELRKRRNPSEWFKVHILEDGAQFLKATVDPRSADVHDMDTRAAYRVADVFNLHPSKMGLPGSDSYGAGESARVDHVTGCLNHVFTQIAGECYIKLLNPKQRRMTGDKMRVFQHDYSRLVEPDFTSLVTSLVTLRNAAVINANDILARVGMKTRTDPDATKYFNPSTAAKNLDESSEKDDDAPAKDAPENDSSKEQDDDDRTSPAEDQTARRTRAIVPRLRTAAHRVALASKSRCKQASSFAGAVQGGFREQRHIFRDELRPVISLWDCSETVVAESEDRFFAHLGSLVADRLASLSSTTDSLTSRQRHQLVCDAADDLVDRHADSIAVILADAAGNLH